MNRPRSAALELRWATAADASSIHRFIVELAEYEREPDAVRITVGQLREAIESDAPPFECRVAMWAQEAVGMALFFPKYSTWRGPGLYLEDLYVRPAHRGKGIGRALLLDLAAIAKERGCTRLDWSVLEWNKPAITFYESLGAEMLSDWRIFRLSDDALSRAAASASNETDAS